MPDHKRLLAERTSRRADLLGHMHRYTEMVQGRRPLPAFLTRQEAVSALQGVQMMLEECEEAQDGYGHHWVPDYRRQGENLSGEMVCRECRVPYAMDITGEGSYR